MEYILFIHNNAEATPTAEDWKNFLAAANASGVFLGGSEIANSVQIGVQTARKITDRMGGFMRFETGDVDALLRLLEKHPVFVKGGTLELCEMPKTNI